MIRTFYVKNPLTKKQLLLAIVSLISVTYLALSLRLSEWGRPFWLDEADHILCALKSKNFVELRQSAFYFFVPILELCLRKWIWFPLTGVSEIGARIPSLVYSLGTVICASLLTFRYLQRSYSWKAEKLIFLSATAALFYCFNITEIHYASEARGYSFISLVSLLWFFDELFLSATGPLKFLLNLLFLNAHFFSLPFILASFSRRLYRATGNQSKIFSHLGELLFILTCSFYINEPEISGLLGFTKHPASRMANETTAERLWSGIQLLYRYWENLGGPCIFFVVIALLIFLLCFQKNLVRKNRYLFGLVYLLLPALLISIRIISKHEFSDRYFMPFMGLGFSYFIFCLKSIAATKYEKHLYMLTLVTAVACVIRDNQKITMVSEIHRNSSYVEIFNQISAKNKTPIILAALPAWQTHISELYFSYFVTPPRAIRVASPIDEQMTMAVNPFFLPGEESNLQATIFSEFRDQDITLVFLFSSKQCYEAGNGSSRQGIAVEKYEVNDSWWTGSSCIWSISGKLDVKTIRAIMQDENIPAIRYFY